MDWLFGCFGAAGKKARKHGDSNKVPQLRPFQPFPVKVSPPSSIALKGFALREEATNHEDLPGGTRAESIPCQERLERTADKLQKGKPWSRLEDLEEEREDLGKQTENESPDAKKIKEEVPFLKSCGALLQTPAELRKKNRPLETQQGITSLKGWHSWLVPSSPNLKLHFAEPPNSQSAAESVHVNIPHHVQTPNIHHHVQTPMFENDRKEGNLQAASSSMSGQEKEKVADSRFGLQDTLEIQQDADVHDSSGCKQEAIKLAKLDNETLIKDVPTIEGEQLLASSRLDSNVLMLGNDNAILTCESVNSNLKRLEIPTATDAKKEAPGAFTNSGQKGQAHTLNDVQATLSPETANSRSRTAALDAKGTLQSIKHRYPTEESSKWSSYTVPESPSSSSGLTDESGEILEPSLSNSSSNHQHCVGFEGIFHNNQDACSGGGHRKGFCYGRYDGSQFDSSDTTASFSMKSEENSMMDSCAENSLREIIPECNGEDRQAGFWVVETPYSYGSAQHSVAESARRITQIARHGCEYDESKDDDLSSDAVSHASVECTQASRYKQIIGQTAGIFRPEDQNFIETPFKISQWIATPEFQRSPIIRSRPSSPVLTPVENTLHWKQLKTTKDTLEMGEQGDKYNCNAKASYKDHDPNGVKALTTRGRTGCTVAGTQEESWGENEHGVWMNPAHKELGLEKKLASSNVSLSQWLTPSPEQSRNCSLVSPTPLLRSYVNMPHRFDAETASSLWTPRPANARGESMSCAPEALPLRVDMSLSNWPHASGQQDQGTYSEVTPAAFLRHSSHSRNPDSRPILGVIAGDIHSNSATAREAQWDGKGIPNTTSKYKEESRVSWHASPFEVRLERALVSQGESLNGMCDEAASSTPVSKRLQNVQDL